MMFKESKFFGLILGLSTLPLWAQGPPIITDSALLIGLNGGSFRVFSVFSEGKNGNRLANQMIVPYNVNSQLQLGAGVNYIFLFPEGSSQHSGIGNINFFIKNEWFRYNAKGKTFRVTGKLNVLIPTSETAPRSTLGTNARGFSPALLASYVTTKWGVYTEAGKQFMSDRQPDPVFYNLAVVVPLLPQKYPPFQINLSWEINGSHIPEMDIEPINITQGLQWIYNEKSLFEIAYQRPVVDRNAINNRWNVLFGIRKLIF